MALHIKPLPGVYSYICCLKYWDKKTLIKIHSDNVNTSVNRCRQDPFFIRDKNPNNIPTFVENKRTYMQNELYIYTRTYLFFLVTLKRFLLGS